MLIIPYTPWKLYFKKLVEILGIVLCFHGLYGTTSLELPVDLAPGGQFQFLTNLCSLFSCLTLTTVFIWPSIHTYDLACIVCNLEFVVTIAYWVLFFLFGYMLNKDAFNVPLYLDLEIHFFPWLFLLPYAQKKSKKLTFIKSSIATSLVLAGYWLSIEYNHYFLGTRYPYPFLINSSFSGRYAWLLIFSIVACTNYFILQIIKINRFY